MWFCSAGILASTKHFLNQHSNPKEDEIKDMLTGHICRCTGYAGMVKAIQEFVDWSPERARNDLINMLSSSSKEIHLPQQSSWVT